MGRGIDPEVGKNLRYEEIKRLCLFQPLRRSKKTASISGQTKRPKKEETLRLGSTISMNSAAGRRRVFEHHARCVGKREQAAERTGRRVRTINRKLGIAEPQDGLARKRGKSQDHTAFPMQAVHLQQGYARRKQFIAIRTA